MNISYRITFLGISLIFFGYIIGVGTTNLSLDELRIFRGESTATGMVRMSDLFESKKIQEAYKYIEQNYYGFHSKSQKAVEDALLSSMAMSLGDKHSVYFNEEESIKFVDTLKGDFEGIGAVIRENIKGIQIMKVLSGSPAEKSKLTAGDIITYVDGKSMLGMTADEAVNLIRGPK